MISQREAAEEAGISKRQQVTADQRYLIWKSCHEKSEAWESEKLRIFSDANRKRAEATKAQHEVSNPRAGETMVVPQVVGQPLMRDHAAKHASSSTTAKAEAWESEKLRIFSDANRKRAEATKAQHEVSNPRSGETMVGTQPVCRPYFDRPKGSTNATQNQKAEASKTNRGSVERMDALVNSRPDLAEKVKTGEIKSAEAIREMKREELVAKLEDVKT